MMSPGAEPIMGRAACAASVRTISPGVSPSTGSPLAGSTTSNENVVLGQVQAVAHRAHARACPEDVGDTVEVVELGRSTGFRWRHGWRNGAAWLARHDDAPDPQIPRRIDALLLGVSPRYQAYDGVVQVVVG